MPAEFEAHRATWMLWPTRPDNWRLGAVPAQAAFRAVAQAIAQFEPVTIGFPPSSSPPPTQAGIDCLPLPADDAWMRDVGATFVYDADGGLVGVDWQFNAWGGENGGLYPDWRQDDAVAATMCACLGIPSLRADFILEGGAIHVDGQGTLVTTEECLLNPNRNPHLSRAEIEAKLAHYLGVQKVIWLPWGVYNDETDGHVDNLCAFVAPAEVVLTWTDDPNDPQYERSQAAYDVLSRERDAQGRPFTVHKLHQPDQPLLVTAEEVAGLERREGSRARYVGERLAASYVNFYIANGGIIAPQFGDAQDAPALATLARLFPTRRVLGIPSREILLGGGNIHCITQQVPR
jgi:agmatine deiminase